MTKKGKLERQAYEDEQTSNLVIRSLMAHRNGRRYLWLQLAELYIFASTFTLAPGGTLITAFKEGQRAYGLKLLSRITTLCPSEFTIMLTENGKKPEDIENVRDANTFTDRGPEPDSDAGGDSD